VTPHEKLGEMHRYKEEDIEGGHLVAYVKVRDRPSWIDGSAKHLEKLVGRNSGAHTCKKEG
jgi:hypothetical protein